MSDKWRVTVRGIIQLHPPTPQDLEDLMTKLIDLALVTQKREIIDKWDALDIEWAVPDVHDAKGCDALSAWYEFGAWLDPETPERVREHMLKVVEDFKKERKP